jgi:hypothetical protein
VVLAHREVAQRHGGDDESDGADRDVDVEDPAPRGVLHEPSTEQRTGDAREAEDGAEVSLVAPFTRGDDVADDRDGEHHQATGAEALDGTEGDQLVHVLGEPGQDRAHQEHDDRELEDVLAAVEVGHLAVVRGGGGRGEQIGRHDPRVTVEAVEVADDGRKSRADDGLVKRREQQSEHQPGEHDEDLAMCHQPAAGRLNRFLGDLSAGRCR